VRAFGYGNITALTISASLAQIGEFSFILVALGVDLHLLPEEGPDLFLAAARYRAKAVKVSAVKAAAEAPAQAAADKAATAKGAEKGAEKAPPAPTLPVTAQQAHTVLVGYGRVGHLVADGLKAAGLPFLVIEDQEDRVEELRRSGIEVIDANAASPAAITAANMAGATRLILAIPDGFEASGVLRKARQMNPGIEIIARAHSDAEVEHLRQGGANFIIMGEREVARGMLAHVLDRSEADLAAAVQAAGVASGAEAASPSPDAPVAEVAVSAVTPPVPSVAAAGAPPAPVPAPTMVPAGIAGPAATQPLLSAPESAAGPVPALAESARAEQNEKG